MRLTPEEIDKAKRAARRLWCPGDANGKHTLAKAVIDGAKLGWRCAKCGYETIPQNMKATP